MADKQIYQLTETLSVSPDDWLAIDLDSSNLTRKARVGNVFSVSEGSAYTGGTADGIMFNDGDTFTTDANLTWDGSALGAGDISFRPLDSVPSIQGVYFKGTTGSNWQIAATNSVTYIAANNNVQFWTAGVIRAWTSVDGFYIGNTQGSIGARLHVVAPTDQIAQRIDLSNGQTADAFQINSYGNTGGDLFRVESDGFLNVSTKAIGDIARFASLDGTNNSALTIKSTSAGIAYNLTWGANATNHMWQTYGTERMRLNSVGLEVDGKTKATYFYSTNPSGIVMRDNRENNFITTSADTVTSNRTMTFANGTYSQIHFPYGLVAIGHTNPSAKLHTSLSTDVVGHRLDLSNGQTADAFQINSYGNTGGDVLRVTAGAEVSIGNVTPAIKGLTIETTAGVSNDKNYGIRFNAASGNSAIIYQVTPEVLRFTSSSSSYIELQALKLGQPSSWSIGKPSSSEGITVTGNATTTDTTIVSLEAARGQSNTTDEVRGLRTTWSINPTSGSNNIVDVALGGGLAWSGATGWTGKAIGVLVSPRIGDGTDNSATERILLDVGNNTNNAPNYSSHTSVFKIHTDGRVSLLNLPTSSAGLSSGDLWNDSGTIKIV